MSTSREVDNETIANVNFRFAVVIEYILRMHDITIPYDTKKATREIR